MTTNEPSKRLERLVHKCEGRLREGFWRRDALLLHGTENKNLVMVKLFRLARWCLEGLSGVLGCAVRVGVGVFLPVA